MKVLLLLLAILVATAVKAESPSQDETQGNDEVVEEFDSDQNDAPSDDESELDSTELEADSSDPNELEAQEEDFNVQDPINARSYYCRLCKVCRYCRRSRRCSSSFLSRVCSRCRYCSWRSDPRLVRRIRIRVPPIRVPRVHWGRRRRWGWG